MAAISGKDGNATLAGGYTTNVFQWEAELTAESLDTTPFNPTGGWRTRIVGLLSMRGSYQCWIDDTTTLPVGGVAGAVALTADTGRTYSGNVIVTSARVGVAADGSQRVMTCSFESNGQITPG